MEEKLTAQVFDIKRFAMHDGAGIRTTVFFSGCPLKCVWCQNPEGLKKEKFMMHFKNKCIHCNKCLGISKNGGVYEKNGNIYIDNTKEEDYEKIVYECPTGAMRFSHDDYTVDELVSEVLKDTAFFKYGGGVTASGGECFIQWRFLKEFFKKLKQNNIHTAVETCLYVKKEILDEVLPYIDFLYIDLKLFDSDKHKEYTGADNKLIKENLEYLLHSDKKDNIIIRTPLIPGMTANKDNLEKIADFLSSLYADVTVELLNYNPLAKSKYELVGEEFCFEENSSKYTKAQMEEFYNIMENNGIKNIVKNF